MNNDKTLNVSFGEAQEWYNSGNETLINLAKKLWKEEDLQKPSFYDVKLIADISIPNFYEKVIKVAELDRRACGYYVISSIKKELMKKYPEIFEENDSCFYPYIEVKALRGKALEVQGKGYALSPTDTTDNILHNIEYIAAPFGFPTEEMATHVAKWFALYIAYIKYGDTKYAITTVKL